MTRMFLVVLLLVFAIQLNSTIWQNGSLQINDIRFNLVPEVNYRTSTNLCEPLNFTSTAESYPDSCKLNFSSSKLEMTIRIVPQTGFAAEGWKVIVSQTFTQDIIIRDIALQLDWPDSTDIVVLRGPEAINSNNPAKNTNLYPYTDKQMQVQQQDKSLWITASGYSGCENVEWLSNDKIYFYDNTLHFARLYGQSDINIRLIDIKSCLAGQTESWSFLIFAERPYLLDWNLWPRDKKAALAISNDADGETASRLKSVFFGSNNTQNPVYLTKGLVANNIKVSNTVFGIHYDTQHSVWDDIADAGSKIGYHTYSDFGDSTYAISNSLLGTMADYNIRLWVDHSIYYNPEDFAMSGGSINTPYYILDIINQSSVDYAWLGDTPASNPFNLFIEPWRLPHRIYYFQALTKPVWFFGRTRMEAWEYLNDLYLLDFRHNMTPENLETLLDEKGVCIGYTHFSFGTTSTNLPFYDVQGNGDYVIRDDVNDVFEMLDYYQTSRGLWIDTVENIFDRMLAVDKVTITEVVESQSPGFVRLTVKNTSDQDISDLEYYYGSYAGYIALLPAGETETFLLNINNPPEPDETLLPLLVQFQDGSVFVRSRELLTMPALKVKIYNIKGQLITSGSTSSEQNYLELPFGSKASGLYFARIETAGYKDQLIRFTVLK